MKTPSTADLAVGLISTGRFPSLRDSVPALELIEFCQLLADKIHARDNPPEVWPEGATVKLRWVGPGGPAVTGWARRGFHFGELLSVNSGYTLNPAMWEVIEDRSSAG